LEKLGSASRGRPTKKKGTDSIKIKKVGDDASMMARVSEMKGWQVKTKGGCLVKKTKQKNTR